MGEIVSLRQHRKRKERAEKDVHAAENRARFGRTKAEREIEEAQAAKADKNLDGHKRED